MAIYLPLFSQPPQAGVDYYAHPSGTNLDGIDAPSAGSGDEQSVYLFTTGITPASPYAGRNVSGSCQPAYKKWFYDQIYVIPAAVNLGRVLADFDTTVEVWNAWIEVDHTLQSVTGPTEEESGVTLIPVDGDPPTSYPTLVSRNFNLHIDFDGPPSADATFSFDFSSEVPTLKVTGYRIIMFPYVPQEGYTERFRWLTDVIEAFDGSEQFVKTRPIPRRELDYRYVGSDTIDRGRFYNILASSIGYEVGVPIWQQGKNPTQTVTSGSTRIYVDTTSTEYEVGKPGFLFQDIDIRESFEVAAIQPTYLDTVSPIENFYDLDALVMPVLICDMPQQINSQLSALNATTLSLTFRGKESTDLGTASLADQYKSLDVLHDCPEIEGSTLTWTHSGNWQDIDFTTGLMEHDFAVQYAKTIRSFRKTFQEDRAGAWSFKKWLYKLAGRQGRFWVPSYTGKIQVVGDIPSTTVDISIVNCQLATVWGNTPFVTDVEFEFLDGTIIRRDVLSVVRATSAVETMTLDNTIGRDFNQNDIHHISLLHKVRLDSDTVEFRWEDNGTCTVSFNTRELIN